MIEWMGSHTNVIYQPPVGHPPTTASTLRPGFWACTATSSVFARTHRGRPPVVPRPGRHALATLRWITPCAISRDESFMASTSSLHLMREMRLFAIHDDAAQPDLLVQRHSRRLWLPYPAPDSVAAIRPGYARTQYPGLNVNLRGDRTLVKAPHALPGRPLADVPPRCCVMWRGCRAFGWT